MAFSVSANQLEIVGYVLSLDLRYCINEGIVAVDKATGLIVLYISDRIVADIFFVAVQLIIHFGSVAFCIQRQIVIFLYGDISVGIKIRQKSVVFLFVLLIYIGKLPSQVGSVAYFIEMVGGEQMASVH